MDLIEKLEARLAELRAQPAPDLPPNASAAHEAAMAMLIEEITDRLSRLKAGEVDVYA